MSERRSGFRWCSVREQVTPGGFGPQMIGRLKPGTDRAQLVAQLAPLARRVQERLGGPAPYKHIMERHRPVVKPLREQLVGKIATPLWILLGTVGIVFLIACVNVANLFTVRAESRRNDLAVRRALGAGRGDLVRSQMTEALLLAAAGGAAGASHRVGRCAAAGARGAGSRGRRLRWRTDSRPRHGDARRRRSALYRRHLGSGRVPVWAGARATSFRRAPRHPPGRPDEAWSAAAA